MIIEILFNMMNLRDPLPDFGAIRKKAKSQGLFSETMVNLLLQEQTR
jgi:hypothetical protein